MAPSVLGQIVKKAARQRRFSGGCQCRHQDFLPNCNETIDALSLHVGLIEENNGLAHRN